MKTLTRIRTEADHDAAVRVLRSDEDGDKSHGLTDDQLYILAGLVSEWEEQSGWHVEPESPVEFIQGGLDLGRYTRKDLEPCLGSSAKVSEVLSGRRGLSLAMIAKLSVFLDCPTDWLIDKSEARALLDR